MEDDLEALARAARHERVDVVRSRPIYDPPPRRSLSATQFSAGFFGALGVWTAVIVIIAAACILSVIVVLILFVAGVIGQQVTAKSASPSVQTPSPQSVPPAFQPVPIRSPFDLPPDRWAAPRPVSAPVPLPIAKFTSAIEAMEISGTAAADNKLHIVAHNKSSQTLSGVVIEIGTKTGFNPALGQLRFDRFDVGQTVDDSFLVPTLSDIFSPGQRVPVRVISGDISP